MKVWRIIIFVGRLDMTMFGETYVIEITSEVSRVVQLFLSLT